MSDEQVHAPTVDGEDAQWLGLLHQVGRRVQHLGADDAPLFLRDGSGVFSAFLEGLPAHRRQHYTCHACRRFLEAYGGLVAVESETGTLYSLWEGWEPPPLFADAVRAMRLRVRGRPIREVLIADKGRVGAAPANKSEKHGGPAAGTWNHFSFQAPAGCYHSLHGRAYDTRVEAASVRHDALTLIRYLSELRTGAAREAYRLLQAGDVLPRSSQFVARAAELASLHESWLATDSGRRPALAWKAAAMWPQGWAHVRGGVLGQLIDEVAAGTALDIIRRRFGAMVAPTAYQRPQAAPTAGAIAEAERLFQRMGLAPSLRRRFATLDEVVALWRPLPHPVPESPDLPGASIFGNLVAKGNEPVARVPLPSAQMAWSVFRRDVLPRASDLELRVPTVGNFFALTTASDETAPPIIRWDHEDRRNPVSMYLYASGSQAAKWGLTGNGAWCPVEAVADRPAHWCGAVPGQMHGALFVLHGARDHAPPGVALFPETLRSELHAVRSVIEAYSAQARLEDAGGPPACGLLCGEEGGFPVRLKVVADGAEREYLIDRWE